AQSAAIHARFARGQELLFVLQSQVLLASIYVRDALVADEESQAATMARDQLRALHVQVKQELEQYDAVEPPNQGAAWGRLKAEVQNYWDAAVRLAAPAPKDSAAADDRLRNDVIARGDVIVKLSDDLRQVMADNANQEQQQVGETNATLRRWTGERRPLPPALGLRSRCSPRGMSGDWRPASATITPRFPATGRSSDVFRGGSCRHRRTSGGALRGSSTTKLVKRGRRSTSTWPSSKAGLAATGARQTRLAKRGASPSTR